MKIEKMRLTTNIVIALKPYTVDRLRKSQPGKIMLIMRERFTTESRTPLTH